MELKNRASLKKKQTTFEIIEAMKEEMENMNKKQGALKNSRDIF